MAMLPVLNRLFPFSFSSKDFSTSMYASLSCSFNCFRIWKWSFKNVTYRMIHTFSVMAPMLWNSFYWPRKRAIHLVVCLVWSSGFIENSSETLLLVSRFVNTGSTSVDSLRVGLKLNFISRPTNDFVCLFYVTFYPTIYYKDILLLLFVYHCTAPLLAAYEKTTYIL